MAHGMQDRELFLIECLAAAVEGRVAVFYDAPERGADVSFASAEELTKKDVEHYVRVATQNAGFRAQKGCWATNKNNEEAMEFYVIKGNYDTGSLAVIRCSGSAKSPYLAVEFGG